MKVDKELFKKIKELKAAGMKQREIAEELGMSQATVSRTLGAAKAGVAAPDAGTMESAVGEATDTSNDMPTDEPAETNASDDASETAPANTSAVEVPNLDSTYTENAQRIVTELTACVHDDKPIKPIDDGKVLPTSGKRGRPTKRETEQNQRARNSVEAARSMVSQETLNEMSATIGRLYTLEEIAAYLGVTSRTILAYLKDGRLKGVKAGGVWRISADNLKRFVTGE